MDLALSVEIYVLFTYYGLPVGQIHFINELLLKTDPLKELPFSFQVGEFLFDLYCKFHLKFGHLCNF